MENNVEHRRTG